MGESKIKPKVTLSYIPRTIAFGITTTVGERASEWMNEWTMQIQPEPEPLSHLPSFLLSFFPSFFHLLPFLYKKSTQSDPIILPESRKGRVDIKSTIVSSLLFLSFATFPLHTNGTINIEMKIETCVLWWMGKVPVSVKAISYYCYCCYYYRYICYRWLGNKYR